MTQRSPSCQAIDPNRGQGCVYPAVATATSAGRTIRVCRTDAAKAEAAGWTIEPLTTP